MKCKGRTAQFQKRAWPSLVHLVFVIGNWIALHAVYRRAPAGSVAFCDVLCREEEQNNLGTKVLN